MGKQGGGGGGPAPFLVKTHDMVEDAGTDEVISWEEKGRSFVVWKPVEFARDLLPAHFKHNNFSSFVRQLNTYGFRKVVPDRWEFGNEYFRRGEQRLLSEIRRRKSVSTSPNPSALKSTGSGRRPTLSTSNSGDVQSTSSASSPPPPPPWPVTPQLLELSHENEKLYYGIRLEIQPTLGLSSWHQETSTGIWNGSARMGSAEWRSDAEELESEMQDKRSTSIPLLEDEISSNGLPNHRRIQKIRSMDQSIQRHLGGGEGSPGITMKR